MSENQHLCALVFLTSLFCSTCSQGTRFVHSAALDADGRYNIKWGFDESTITFEVEVETTGYIGFGLSPTGAMSSSDIVIGGVLNGSPYLLVSVHAPLGVNASLIIQLKMTDSQFKISLLHFGHCKCCAGLIN